MRLMVGAGVLACAFAFAAPTLVDADPGTQQLAAFPAIGRLDYTVVRGGDKIGSHSVVFQRKGDALTVTTSIDIAVKVLGLTVFKFKHHAVEDWVDGHLERLSSQTNDDGEKRAVDLRLDGGKLRGFYNGEARDLPPNLLPASLWHPETIRQSVLLDPIKGRLRQVQIVDKGVEALVVKGRTLMAKHYAITGQMTRDVWYGPDGRIVQVTFPAKDGSKIVLVPR